MLFFNFLCLFYLMVLIDSHTLSKSIAKDDETINIIDSVHGIENDKEGGVKRSRLHITNEFREDVSKLDKGWLSANEEGRKTTPNIDIYNISVQVTDVKVEKKCDECPKATSHHPKGFLRRLFDKVKRKKKINNVLTNAIVENGKVELVSKDVDKTVKSMNRTTVAIAKGNKKTSNKHKHKKNRRKRFLIIGGDTATEPTLTSSIYDYLTSNNASDTNSDVYDINTHWVNNNYTSGSSHKLTSGQPYGTIIQYMHGYHLAYMGDQTTTVKHVDGTPSYRKFRSVHKNSEFNYDRAEPIQNAATENYFGETAQISVELDKLKIKAFQTATDEYSYPKFGFSKVSFVEGIPISIGAISLQPPLVPSFYVEPIRNGYYRAQTVQPPVTKLKRVVLTPKKQFKSSNFKPFKYWTDKLEKKNSKRTKNIGRQKNCRRLSFIEYKAISEDGAGTFKYRDKKMSTVYRLEKGKLLTKQPFRKDKNTITTEATVKLYKINKKRDSLTYLDFDDKETQPNHTYSFEDYNSMRNKSANKIEYSSIAPNTKYTILEDLVEKLHYKDYVNGYKHYLKFQKEQGNQNYSNLVRYQAHRHHNVDDIGKFILNKLPQVPGERQRRAFYDESETTEDQDISTKNEESWFKKHFYVFIDSGQPKMYHTSQTISLRPPSVEPDFTEKSAKTRLLSDGTGYTTDIDLDNLARSLGKYKGYTTSFTTESTIDTYEENVNDDESFEAMIEESGLGEESGKGNVTVRMGGGMRDMKYDRRSKRDSQTQDADNDFQFYHGYMPKSEAYSAKHFRHRNASLSSLDKIPDKPGYVGVNVVPKLQTTALVNLRNGKHKGTMRRFLQRIRSRFAKKKKEGERTSIKMKAKIQKRSTRHARSLNPLKKLKEIFGTRIDRKQETGSKLFDYEVYMKHVAPYKSSSYKGLIDSVVTAMNTSKLVTSSMEAALESSPPAEKYEEKTIYPPKTKALNVNRSNAEYRVSAIKTTASLTTSQQKHVAPQTSSTVKNRTEFDDSSAVNMKVTTIFDDGKSSDEHVTWEANSMAESISAEVSKLIDKMRTLQKTTTTTESFSQDLKSMQKNDFTSTQNLSHSKKKIIEKDDNANEEDDKSYKNKNNYLNTKSTIADKDEHVHANDFINKKIKNCDYVDTKNEITVNNNNINENGNMISKNRDDYSNAENTVIEKDDNIESSALIMNKNKNFDYTDARDEIIEKDDNINENDIIINRNGHDYPYSKNISYEKYEKENANDFMINRNKNSDYTDAKIEVIEGGDNINERDFMTNNKSEFTNMKNTLIEKNNDLHADDIVVSRNKITDVKKEVIEKGSDQNKSYVMKIKNINTEYSSTKNDKNLNDNKNNITTQSRNRNADIFDPKNKLIESNENTHASDIMINNNRLTNFPRKIFHLLTQIGLNNESAELNTATNDTLAEETVEDIQLVPKTINKRAKSTSKTDGYNVTNMARDGLRRGYQTLPNFFNDFEMWHNDILHSEKIDTWQKILNNINQPLRYRPPDVTTIERELNTIRKHMYTHALVTKKPTTAVRIKTTEKRHNKVFMNNTLLKPVHLVRREDEPNNGFKKLLNNNQDSYDKLMEFDKNLKANLSRIATTQYSKVLHDVTDSVRNDDTENKEESRGSTIYLEPASDATLVMGTTLLAYDDSLQFITGKSGRSKDKSPTPSNNTNHSAKIVTKLHKVPDQYFSTPLPMRSKDFDNFLKENSLDIKSITTPLDFFSATDNAIVIKEKKDKAKTNNRAEGLTESDIDYRQKYKYYRLFDLKNIVENGTETVLTSAPVQMKGRYKNSELYNKNYFFDYDKLMDDFDENGMTANKLADSSGTSGVVIFNKIKDRLKNLGNKKINRTTNSHNGSSTSSSIRATKLNDVIVTEIYFDELEDTHEDKKIKLTSHIKSHGGYNSKSTNKINKNSKQYEIKTKTEITITAPPTMQSVTKCHKTRPNVPNENKKNSGNSQFVHNNLLFSYINNRERINEDIKTFRNSFPLSVKDNEPPNDSETVSDRTPVPPTGEHDNTKSIWNDFILKYVSGIALIELLSKFGIIKAVEANLTDGKERDANTCGVFSGCAEPSYGTHVTQGDAIARVGRSLKGATRHNNLNSSLKHKRSENETICVLNRRTTTQPTRRGTIIYDLKRVGKPRETKQRRGHTKFDKTSTKKDYPTVKNRIGLTAIKDVYGNAALSEPQLNNSTSSTTTACAPSTIPTTTTTTSPSSNATAATTTPVTTTPITTTTSTTNSLDKINSDGLNYLDKDLNVNTKATTKSKQKATTRSRHRVAVIITKIYSEAKNKANRSKESFSGNEMQHRNTISAVQFAKKKNASSSSKAPNTYTHGHTTASRRASPITKTSETLKSSSEFVNLYNPTELDVTTPFEDGSLYVTNYYDIDPMDTEYISNKGGHLTKTENATKTKDLFSMKHDKRDVKSQETYTAKNVAALEIIVDLMRNKRLPEENETSDAENENSTKIASTNPCHTNTRPNDTVSNSIQVYIEIPYNYYNERKRSVHDTVKIRKIFTAKLLTPVDIEYQIHSAEVSDVLSSEQEVTSGKAVQNATTTTTTTTPAPSSVTTTASTKINAFSGGLYVLVEDNNNSIPNGHYILKPVHNNAKLFANENVETKGMSMAQKSSIDKVSNILPNVTLTKEFIAAVNKHLVELYQNVGSLQHKIKARNVSGISMKKKRNSDDYQRDRRRLNWETIKKYFGHDKVCNCNCKPNHTMCRACAASDAVISEIIFELDNLAQYMNDHCTEIQTYFWMNPSGGRKLRDAVHRIDKTLYDYYKRAKGKCKGRPCKHFTYIEKRDFINAKGINYIGDPMIRDMEKIADDLENAAKYNIGNDQLFDTGTKCLDVITKCMHLKPFNKRADDNKKLIKNVYSLDNVNVNIICKQDNIESPPNDLDHSTLLSTLLPPPTEPPTMFYYDPGGYKTVSRKRKKGFKSFLSFRKSCPKVNKMTKNPLFVYTDTPLDGTIALNKLRLHKRQIANNDEIESPIINGGGDLFWYNRSSKNINSVKVDSEIKTDEDENNIRTNGNKVIVNVSLNIPSRENYTNYNKPTYDEKTLINLELDGKMLPTTLSDIISLANKNKDSKNKRLNDSFLGNEAMNLKKASNSHREKGSINLLDKDESTQLEKPCVQDGFRPEKSFNKSNDKRIRNIIGSLNAFQRLTDKTSMNQSKKKKKTKRRSLISRMKEATLNFLDKLDGTDNFLIDNRTTPVYVYGRPTRPTKYYDREVKSNEINNIMGKIYKNDVLIDQTDIVKPLKVARNYKKSAPNIPKNVEVTDISYNKELLLSILDFETNKLNEEWKRVAAVMSTKDDPSDAENDTKVEYRPSPEVPMSEKTVIKKAIHTTTATSKRHVSKSANRARKEGKIFSSNNDASTSKGCDDSCGNYYDIREDLPNVELDVPPYLTSTKAYSSLFDKIARKFAIKILPEQRTDKDMPKGRSIKRKIPNHSRQLEKATLKASPSALLTTVVDVRESTLTTRSITSLNKRTKAKTKAIQIVKAKKKGQTSNKALERNQMTLARLTLTPLKITVNDTVKKVEKEEACDWNRQPLLCDIDATMINIEEVYKRVTKSEFARYVKNITCARYKKPPQTFDIKAKQKKGIRHRIKPDRVPCGGARKSKWNWIRGKRSPPSSGQIEAVEGDDDIEFEPGLDVENLQSSRSDRGHYEKLYLGGDGIYRVREAERKKRGAVDMTTVVNSLKHLPPLRQLVDEVFVLHGDSISIQCNVTDSLFTGNNMTDLYRYSWSAERRAMLKRWNVNVVGPTVSITQAEPKNYGTYTCYQDSIVSRSVRLNIINIPSFNIVFTPLYRCQGDCTYEDLENIQRLGIEMGRTVSCCGGDSGVFRIDHPVCLSNKENEDYLRPTVVMIPISPMSISCEAECQRDLTCSLALLAAQNVPLLANVSVLIRYDRLNKTLVPDNACTPITDLDVMKSLKFRDSNGHREYRRLSMTMRPGDVDVVVVCPAGYYLVADQKICVVCPANTCSLAGQNACSACPRGTHADPGSAACRIGLGRLRRYERREVARLASLEAANALAPALARQERDWSWAGAIACRQWLWSLWQWYVAVCLLVCLGCTVAWMSSCRRRRRKALPAASRLPIVTAAPLIVRRRSSTGRRRARRPISPSRVLLERLFKHSPSSSRASDSQETRICVWKEKNVPPPLPPIDFDYW